VKSEPDMLKPLFQDINSLLLPNANFAPASTRRWIPSYKSWLKAICLLPLAIPGSRVIISGLSWFDWLRFPGSWLIASAIFILMHLVLPVFIIGIFYYIAQSFRQIKSTTRNYRIFWFSFSTTIIIILSFLGTVGVTALVNIASCQFPQPVKIAETCVNYFAVNDWQSLVLSLETYNFSYYQWLIWLTITAYLYKSEEQLLNSL
jgi:hypothetical protein